MVKNLIKKIDRSKSIIKFIRKNNRIRRRFFLIYRRQLLSRYVIKNIITLNIKWFSY